LIGVLRVYAENREGAYIFSYYVYTVKYTLSTLFIEPCGRFYKGFTGDGLMPRHADPELEKRVLDAAQKLWRGGGDKTLSMRALAKAARTNTPAIYRRFKDRKDILRALLLRARTKQVEAIQSARSLEEALDLYIDFALRNPWEYELYYLQEHEQMRPPVSRSPEIGPGFVWLQQQLAERLGASPEEHAPLALSLWGLAHGTVMLLISKVVPAARAAELRAGCREAIKVLLKAAERNSL
jgi:AcrR family transcriptional regulator